jgi:hypothetical protein
MATKAPRAFCAGPTDKPRSHKQFRDHDAMRDVSEAFREPFLRAMKHRDETRQRDAAAWNRDGSMGRCR